jgi:hypothetical protein
MSLCGKTMKRIWQNKAGHLLKYPAVEMVHQKFIASLYSGSLFLHPADIAKHTSLLHTCSYPAL